MPYIQRATNNYFGFQPVQAEDGSQPLNPYLVSSSEGVDINIGDVVVLTTLGGIRPTTGTWSTGILGVASNYVKAGDGSTSVNLPTALSSQVCFVWDGPDQVFVSHDSSSGVILVSAVGKNVSVISSGVAGSTGPNGTLHRSVMVISAASGTGSTSAVLPFKYLGMHPVEQGVLTSGTTTVTSSGTRAHLVQINLNSRVPAVVTVTT